MLHKSIFPVPFYKPAFKAVICIFPECKLKITTREVQKETVTALYKFERVYFLINPATDFFKPQTALKQQPLTHFTVYLVNARSKCGSNSTEMAAVSTRP
jgi:hypothetical protein